jgi:hypothetical protein
MASDINIGVIGYGYWGPNLVRNFTELPRSNQNLAEPIDTKSDNKAISKTEGDMRSLRS